MAANYPNTPIDNAGASGDTTLVPARSGFRVRALAYNLLAGGQANLKFTDGAGGTQIGGKYPLAAGTFVAAPMLTLAPGGPQGWFETTMGNALVMNVSAAVQVGGVLVYQYVSG